MNYENLGACVADLERTGRLVRINGLELDPHLEAASIQRRAAAKNSPALLFTRVKNSPFPMLANLFGTMERTRFIFRGTLAAVERMLALKADPNDLFKHPLRYARVPKVLWNALPRKVRTGPILDCRTTLSSLPQLVSWPRDGGGYITLPQVYTEDPDKPGFFQSNLGMYRVQMSGNDFIPDKEVGLHYQIHRGIGPHHMAALAKGQELPVNIFVGGPPALTMAAVMPLPEGVPELCFAGALAGRRVRMVTPENGSSARLPMLAEADFCISGALVSRNGQAVTKPEGPFGDHLGYYSLVHDFPLMRVDAVYHRKGAIWPYTSVGRPPQEDTVFGQFIHELTADLVPTVFSGVREVHAVDAAGVHPLLLALGSERYVPFVEERIPQELLTNGLSLLGMTQTSLTKYLFIAAHEDDSSLSTHHVPEFFAHMLMRTDFSRDLHFITRTTMDTLDYSGISLNQGSKLLWAAAGAPVRRLAREIPGDFVLPEGFSNARLFAPGVVVCQGPRAVMPRDTEDPVMDVLAATLEQNLPQFRGRPKGLIVSNVGQTGKGPEAEAQREPKPRSGARRVEELPEEIALVVVVDDADFTAASWDSFLWVAFTRSDPATDLYGCRASTVCKHWGCEAPLIMDARMKPFHAPPLEEDPAVERRIDALAAPGQPLHGLI